MEWILVSSYSPFIWQNAIYAGMIFLSMLYFVITILGGLFEGDIADSGEGDGECDGDDGADDSDDSQSDSGVLGSLDLLNTQHRCPFTFAITSLLLIWGMTGYLLNVFEISLIPLSIGVVLGFLSNMFLSGFLALMIVRRIAPLIARTMPCGQGSTNRFDLIGKMARPSTILEPKKTGYIEICLPNGGIVNKLAKLEGDTGVLRRQDTVYVSDYDHESDIYTVIPVSANKTEVS
jgi:hypothetical protein